MFWELQRRAECTPSPVSCWGWAKRMMRSLTQCMTWKMRWELHLWQDTNRRFSVCWPKLNVALHVTTAAWRYKKAIRACWRYYIALLVHSWIMSYALSLSSSCHCSATHTLFWGTSRGFFLVCMLQNLDNLALCWICYLTAPPAACDTHLHSFFTCFHAIKVVVK